MAARVRTRGEHWEKAVTMNWTALLTSMRLALTGSTYRQNATKFDNAVGESEVRGFAGSLEGVKATKGGFVTNSYFTPQARGFADKIARRIVLIDGQQLAQLIIKYDVGVRMEETLHIKKIDEDFFIFFISE